MRRGASWAMDQATISQLSTAQLTQLLLAIILELCHRLGIEIDPSAVFSFQFPEEAYRNLDAPPSDD